MPYWNKEDLDSFLHLCVTCLQQGVLSWQVCAPSIRQNLFNPPSPSQSSWRVSRGFRLCSCALVCILPAMSFVSSGVSIQRAPPGCLCQNAQNAHAQTACSKCTEPKRLGRPAHCSFLPLPRTRTCPLPFQSYSTLMPRHAVPKHHPFLRWKLVLLSLPQTLSRFWPGTETHLQVLPKILQRWSRPAQRFARPPGPRRARVQRAAFHNCATRNQALHQHCHQPSPTRQLPSLAAESARLRWEPHTLMARACRLFCPSLSQQRLSAQRQALHTWMSIATVPHCCHATLRRRCN